MPHIPRVLCGTCNREMERTESGVKVEMMTRMGGTEVPYYRIMTDRFVCECGNTVLSGFASQPYAEHFQPDYPRSPDAVPARFR